MRSQLYPFCVSCAYCKDSANRGATSYICGLQKEDKRHVRLTDTCKDWEPWQVLRYVYPSAFIKNKSEVDNNG